MTDLVGNALGTANITNNFTLAKVVDNWTGAGKDGNWNDAANWDTGHVPGTLDDVVIALAGTYQITVNTDVTIGSLTLGASSGTQTLIDSHNLSVARASTVGADGIMNLSGSGTLTLNNTLTVNCQLTLSGKTVAGGSTLVIASGGFPDLERSHREPPASLRPGDGAGDGRGRQRDQWGPEHRRGGTLRVQSGQ